MKKRVSIFKKVSLVTMKSVLAVMLIASCLVLLNSCSYHVKLGKKCTPGHEEWSYVWFIEKEGTNVTRNNCEKLAK